MTGQSGWTLQSLNPELGDKQFEIQGSMLVGRSQKSDLCFALIGMSRQHARISVSDDGLLVEDLGSSNGTFINNDRIEKAFAQDGDVIGFDTLKFTVVGPEVDLYNDKTTVHPAVADQAEKETLDYAEPFVQPKPMPAMGPTAIEKQRLVLTRLPKRNQTKQAKKEPPQVKPKPKTAAKSNSKIGGEWEKFALMIIGLGALSGAILIVIKMVNSESPF